MKITEQEMQARKDRIISTAFRLFCQSGIEKVSIMDIAKASRVGDTTIYRYFGNKPLLVLSTLRVLWRSISESLERKVEQSVANYESLTGFQQLAALLETCRQLYLENSDYVLFSYESKLYLQRNHIQLTKEQYDSLMEEIRVLYLHAINKGKADGTIPVKQNSEDLFYAIWGCVRGYIVKIVIYQSLCQDSDPWKTRYPLVEEGILSALSSGWNPPDYGPADNRKCD